MANVNGVNATLIASSGTENLLTRGQQDSAVQCMSDSYTAAALAANSGILMGGVLPKGARIKRIETRYADLYSGGSSVLRVGDAADDDRYQTITVTAAGETSTVAIAGADYVIGTASTDNQIIVKATATSAATGLIKINVYYTQA